jgi:hypothetical protein
MRPRRNSTDAQLRCGYIEEPLLLFGDSGEHVDPKLGISRFGPKSFEPADNHPATVRVGLIGSAESIEKCKDWLETCARGISSSNAERPEFPGFMPDRGFFSELLFDEHWLAQLSHTEIDQVIHTRGPAAKFAAALDLLEAKTELLSTKDRPPEYIVCALPNELLKDCAVVEYKDRVLGSVFRNLRRAYKARAMKFRMPTQILRNETMEQFDPTKVVRKDYPSEIAWDFFTGLYYKAGGLPWGPNGLIPGTCYIGIGFFRALGSSDPRVQTSLVQAFDEHGDGLVLRGHDFLWDSDKEGSKAPHLGREDASRLVDLVLSKYRDEMRQDPQRVVVHKSSRYWPEEKIGFEEALKHKVSRYDLMALEAQSNVRLFSANKYPPLRGTHFSVGDIDFLYTTGYLADLKQFHSVHVPSALQIADHIGGDTSRDTLLREILILTKMNWNSARLGGLLPITLLFSRRIGEIMREIPQDREPLTNFKYYI